MLRTAVIIYSVYVNSGVGISAFKNVLVTKRVVKEAIKS